MGFVLIVEYIDVGEPSVGEVLDLEGHLYVRDDDKV